MRLLLALALAVVCTTFGETFHVDTTGNDTNDGLSPQSPWRSLDKVNTATLRPGDKVLFKRGDIWRGQLRPQNGRDGAPITYGAYGEGAKPRLLGSVSRNDPQDWQHEGSNIWTATKLPLALDVGNVIFDDGKSVGIKKWKQADLKQPGDYWYCADSWQVKTYSEKNPAELHQSIELALRRHIIDQGGRNHVTYENLALYYGAGHGIGGGSTHHIVVRNCDIAWIGGGHQHTRPDGKPVRYGNGIEFWENAHDNLVEGCRIWEIYDAALTNQGLNTNTQANITYRDNVIWNSEYSFEYWNRPQASTTRNIRFEYNTCVNAGFGWGHAQRPDPNGRHLMFYSNPATTTEFFVRNNIFYNATDSALRLWKDWNTDGLTMDRNCWFQPAGTLMLFRALAFTAAQFADYQKQTGLDAHSLLVDPKFVDADHLDFRLATDSPARNLATDGGPVGSRRH